MKYLMFKLGAFGDLSYTLPALEQIQQHDPRAEITWVVGNTYASLLQSHPSLTRVISVQENAFFRGSLRQRLATIYRLWTDLDWYYDQIWLGYRSLLSFLLLRLLVRGSIYQLVRKSSLLLRYWRFEVQIPPLTIHERSAFEALAQKALQVSLKPSPTPEGWIPALTALAPHLSQLKMPYILIHVGGGLNTRTEFDLKKWPHWNSFLQQLSHGTTASLLLIGAPEEVAEAHPYVSDRVQSLVGKTTLVELLSLIRSAQCVIGVDSGPIHWANYFQVPTIGLYGPTSPISWGLVGSHSKTLSHPELCSPCYQDDGHFPACPFQKKCMAHLTPDIVLESMQELLSTSVKHAGSH